MLLGTDTYNEVLHNLYCSRNIITVMKNEDEIYWVCSTHGHEKFIHNFSRNPKGKRCGHRLEHNIKMDVVK
jgi:hypothetical protein